MIIRPRLTDFHDIPVSQADLDFAVPFLDEDIPLYLDPFLLWKSPSQQDQALHSTLINAFNHLGSLIKTGRKAEALDTLIIASECDEVGLGSSIRRKGKRIGRDKAAEILDLFITIPEYGAAGFRHFEEIQLFVDGISKDRVSDIACSFLKSFLIDFTQQQCIRHNIPMRSLQIPHVYSSRKNAFESESNVDLPENPETGSAIIFVPKRWLRFVPWLSFDDYFEKHCPQDDISHVAEELTRVEVLNYNRLNYGAIESYVKSKELSSDDCKNDPLFTQIPVTSARKTFASIKRLPSGKEGNADKEYERLISRLLPSLFYPSLDFAQEQVRTEDGVSIRDLIFYNSCSTQFLKNIRSDYSSKQITFEMKNVAQVSREHVDQLNRYLTNELGNFGVLVTRNSLKRAEQTRLINLWSGQRKSIVTLTDFDIEQMVEVYESRQRTPLEIVLKKYLEFRRSCP